MKNDDDISVLELLKTPRLVHGYCISLRISERDIAHGNADVAIGDDGRVVDGNLAPSLQGKPGICREIGVAADKIRDRAFFGRPKPMGLLRKRWFEEDRAIVIIVKVFYGSDSSFSCFLGAFLIVSRCNSDERIAPFLLRGNDIIVGNFLIGGNGKARRASEKGRRE